MKERVKARRMPRKPSRKKSRKRKKRRRTKRKPRVPTNAQYLKRQARKSLRVELARVRQKIKRAARDRARYRKVLKERRGHAAMLKWNVKSLAKEIYDTYQEIKDCKNLLRGARTSYSEKLPSEVAKTLAYASGWRDSREALIRENSEQQQHAAEAIARRAAEIPVEQTYSY